MLKFLGLLLSLNIAVVGTDFLQPRRNEVHVDSLRAIQDWKYKFNNPSELSNAVSQGGFVKLDGGQTDDLCYAIFSFHQQLLFVVLPSQGGSFKRISLQISNKSDHSDGGYSIKLVPVIYTSIYGPTINGETQGKENFSLDAYCTPEIKDDKTTIHIAFKGWINSDSNQPVLFETKIPWKQ